MANSEWYICAILFILSPAVQNERDRISTRRPSYEDSLSNAGVSIHHLVQAELNCRQIFGHVSEVV